MKIKKILVAILMLTVILSVLGATSVSAQEPVTITTYDEFASAVASGGSYKLGADIVLEAYVRCGADTVIDFAEAERLQPWFWWTERKGLNK